MKLLGGGLSVVVILLLIAPNFSGAEFCSISKGGWLIKPVSGLYQYNARVSIRNSNSDNDLLLTVVETGTVWYSDALSMSVTSAQRTIVNLTSNEVSTSQVGYLLKDGVLSTIVTVVNPENPSSSSHYILHREAQYQNISGPKQICQITQSNVTVGQLSNLQMYSCIFEQVMNAILVAQFTEGTCRYVYSQYTYNYGSWAIEGFDTYSLFVDSTSVSSSFISDALYPLPYPSLSHDDFNLDTYLGEKYETLDSAAMGDTILFHPLSVVILMYK